MKPARSLQHVTLTTGDVRRSWRSEVHDGVVDTLRPLVARAVAGEAVLLPGPHSLTLTAEARGRSLLATIHGAGAALVRMGVADRSTAGAGLWRHLTGDTLPRPRTPWCAATLEPGLVLHPDMVQVAALLGDLERCLAWAWIEGGE